MISGSGVALNLNFIGFKQPMERRIGIKNRVAGQANVCGVIGRNAGFAVPQITLYLK
jgi:hypothetical protein